MSSDSVSRVPMILAGLVLAIACGAVAFSVYAAGRVPDGPVDLVWDKVACAHCGMHVGEPPFAAQLTDKTGSTHAFDDPGCLFLYVEQARPDVHATWFRHHREDRWLPATAVAFARVEPTPMGFGLAAVDPGTADAITLAAARAHCLARESGAGK